VIDWQFAELARVHLVWLAIAAVIVLAVLELRSRIALAGFLSATMQRRLTAQATTGRMVARLALIFLAMLAAIAAVMRPQVRGETETVNAMKATADIMFVLDTSRSMLAEDAAPNRLARAKAEIGQLVGKLESHRVGLVAFAGRAAQLCPLTPDHAFFTTVLSSVDTRSAGRGGTKVGEAIKAAVRGFPAGPGAKLIVLITDGDDQDPYSEDAAKLAQRAGIKIVAIGLGSETGSEITLTDPATGAKTKLMYEGKPVISKLDGDRLRKIALITEGAYIPAGTSAVDLESIMKTHVAPMVSAAVVSAQRVIPAERYTWLVLAALGFLLAALWVGRTP
jgi:Ca-activated chloride channel family protein